MAARKATSVRTLVNISVANMANTTTMVYHASPDSPQTLISASI